MDVAIMAPVPPKRNKTPFLISGPGASKFEETLIPFGLDITIIGGHVGEAATRKLLRSVVYKGFAAVIGEAVAAGEALGLEHYIREQIGALIRAEIMQSSTASWKVVKPMRFAGAMSLTP